ncbi:MAG: TOBE-like domain-containing protein [Candidatus Manganitrophus sp.]|nr:MAG: TOBE-like domain-containing protein [Candidatus Manganitrophus sp.]
MNLFHGRVGEGRVKIGPLEIDAPEHAAAQETPAVAYVRPHDIEIERHKNGQPAIAAKIEHIQSVGPVVRLQLKRQDTGQMIEAELSKERYRELGLKSGEVVFIKPRHWTVYQGKGSDLFSDLHPKISNNKIAAAMRYHPKGLRV